MYSQNDEEQVLADLFNKSTPGMLLDVGAFDGKTFSNSLALIERGWSAVLVEGSPHAFRALYKLHSENERVRLVNALIADNRGIVKFWESADCVSTINPDHFEKWKEAAMFEAPYYAPTITICDVLDAFGLWQSLDFLNIDVEGSSAALLRTFPLTVYASRPRVICVEHDNDVDLETFMSNSDYELISFNQENAIFRRIRRP